MTGDRAPSVTVLVVTICSARHLARCLDALAAQKPSAPSDVLVAYDPRLTDVPMVAQRYARVRLAATGDAQTPPELSARALPAATGELVLLTEDHCEPAPDWVQQLVENHAPDRGAVGGTVDVRPEASPVDWAFFFADFFRFAPPAAPGPSRALTVCNVAYRRADLTAIRGIWQRRFLETEVNDALARRVGALQLVPDARVRTWRHVSLLGGARERYELGRLFAAARVAGATAARRLFWSVGAPLLPLLLLSRMAVKALGTPPLLAPFIRALPALTLFTLTWSWGEWVGYVSRRGPRLLTIERDAGC
jgi:glycosyl transferase family 2